MSDQPSPWRRWWTRVWTGPLVGALVYLGLFVRSVLGFTSGEYMGVRDDAIVGRVLEMFRSEVILLQVEILGLHLAIGAVVGGLCALMCRAWLALRGRRPGSLAVAWRVALLTLVVHAGFLAWALIKYPQTLADGWYGAGGPWRWIQVTLTRFVPPGVVIGLGVLWLLAALALTALAARGPWREGWRRFVRVSPAIYPAALAAGLAAGIAAAPLAFDPTPPQTRDNVLIIAVDSLRPDRLTEDSPVTLPHLRRLASESITFTDAWTVMPRTFPSWVSILTGRYPHEHGIRHMFPSPEALARPRPTLPGALRASGYRTAVVSDFAGDVFSRIQLGFGTVRVPRFTLWSNVELGAWKLHSHLMPYLLGPLGGQRAFPILKLWERLPDPHALTGEALRWVAAGDGRPFCLVVFYSAPHFPYAVPWPWYRLFTDPDYEGPSRYDKRTWTEGRAPGEAEQRQIRALYDGALAATDDAIGDLLEGLRDLDLLDDTHVVVTADHGENLYEAGFGIGHGDHLRGTAALRIPLLVRPAGGVEPRVVDRPVRSIDIAPTVADYVSGRPLLPSATGRTLRPLAEGAGGSDPPIFFETGLWFINPEAAVLEGRTMKFADGFGAYLPDPETHEIYFDPSYEDDFLVAKHRAVLHQGWKLVYIPTRRGVLWELYDVERDPEEQEDVIDEQPKRAEVMKRWLYDWMLQDPELVRLGDYVVPRQPR